MRLARLFTGSQSYSLDQQTAVVLPFPPEAVQLLLDCIVANAIDPESGRAKNKTGEALLELTRQIVTSNQSFANTQERVLLTLRDSTNCKRFPFSSQSKQSVTLVRLAVGDPNSRQGSGKYIVRQFISGAAEVVLANSVAYLTERGTIESLSQEARFRYEEAMTNYNLQGLRTICCGYVDFDATSAEMPHKPLERGFCLLGVVGVEESIRPEVPGAVEACMRAGIRVMMITGDAPLTAVNIAQRCGLLRTDRSSDDAVVRF
ncbi:hypothetical protein AGDE_14680 [Angomonas deanei]|uniref:P-type Cu(+) transporter n=1 Tax=Angomonas deanei TaxID=59799 RepID=A0A7G2CHR2_9TRYP|nr:hypothetical protein AGDE_14680 [Angomonas deanei]CAD2217752.1 hypothetical protein, conserved [Angomonas deanei]|eukprot:EPY20427.1 hypothetical protein AGDE_14680 [Angomonas deanei]